MVWLVVWIFRFLSKPLLTGIFAVAVLLCVVLIYM